MPPLHRYLGNPVLSFIGRLFFRTASATSTAACAASSGRPSLPGPGEHRDGIRQRDGGQGRARGPAHRRGADDACARTAATARRTCVRWRDGWRHLRFLLLFSPRWLFLYPGALLLAGGLFGLGALQHPWGAEGAQELRIHSMLYMAGAMVLGMQLLQLAVLTKWVGVLSGIVPQPAWLRRSEPFLRLEVGLLTGIALLAVGLVWSVGLVQRWGVSGFGALPPTEGMRAAIPAVTLMIVGVQAAAGTLFAGAIELAWRTGRRKGHAA